MVQHTQSQQEQTRRRILYLSIYRQDWPPVPTSPKRRLPKETAAPSRDSPSQNQNRRRPPGPISPKKRLAKKPPHPAGTHSHSQNRRSAASTYQPPKATTQRNRRHSQNRRRPASTYQPPKATTPKEPPSQPEQTSARQYLPAPKSDHPQETAPPPPPQQ